MWLGEYDESTGRNYWAASRSTLEVKYNGNVQVFDGTDRVISIEGVKHGGVSFYRVSVGVTTATGNAVLWYVEFEFVPGLAPPEWELTPDPDLDFSGAAPGSSPGTVRPKIPTIIRANPGIFPGLGPPGSFKPGGPNDPFGELGIIDGLLGGLGGSWTDGLLGGGPIQDLLGQAANRGFGPRIQGSSAGSFAGDPNSGGSGAGGSGHSGTSVDPSGMMPGVNYGDGGGGGGSTDLSDSIATLSQNGEWITGAEAPGGGLGVGGTTIEIVNGKTVDHSKDKRTSPLGDDSSLATSGEPLIDARIAWQMERALAERGGFRSPASDPGWDEDPSNTDAQGQGAGSYAGGINIVDPLWDPIKQLNTSDGTSAVAGFGALESLKQQIRGQYVYRFEDENSTRVTPGVGSFTGGSSPGTIDPGIGPVAGPQAPGFDVREQALLAAFSNLATEGVNTVNVNQKVRMMLRRR